MTHNTIARIRSHCRDIYYKLLPAFAISKNIEILRAIQVNYTYSCRYHSSSIYKLVTFNTHQVTDKEFECRVVVRLGVIEVDEEEHVRPHVVLQTHVTQETLSHNQALV